MIITCEQCETRFELDPNKVPAKGARVRCSRCKHVFQVLPPAVDAAEALEDVALSTAQDPVAAPEPTQDALASPAEDAFATPGADTGDPFADTMQGGRVDLGSPEGPAHEGHRTDAMELSSQEQDWEFNEEPPTAVVEAAAPGAEEASPDSPWPDALETNAPPEPAAASELDFAAAEPPEEPLRDRRRETSSAAPADPAFDDDFSALDDLVEPDDDPAEAGDDADTTDEDLFGSFDDLVDDEPTQSLAGVEPSGAPEAEGVGESASSPSVASVAEAPAEEAVQPSREAEAPAAKASRLPSLRWSTEWSQALGGTFVAGCLAVAVAGVVLEARRVPEVVPQRPGLVGPGLEIAGLGVRLVDNAHAGRILVVTGTLSHAVTDGTRSIRAVLLDANGQRLQTAWAGPDLGEEWLREARPSEIASELEARSGRFAFFGGPVQAVFPEPPGGAADFLFEEATRPPVATPAPLAGPTAQAADAGD